MRQCFTQSLQVIINQAGRCDNKNGFSAGKKNTSWQEESQ